MNGPTVLKILRKFKHPILVGSWKSLKENKNTDDQKNINYRWYWDYSKDYGDSLCIKIKFKNYNKWSRDKKFIYSYDIHLSKEHVFIFHRSYNKFSTKHYLLFSINELYEDLESVLFQQSLLTSTGMVSTQEIEVIKELKDIYFT